ncbi:olfactory receptor 52A5-like [Clupea harengus]|uniref:Olfactory receptor 52A5-like n=1 Tax=Clupea harengus TaxID=7950 RepID=A0A6P8FTK8_CLUHA|nr:olfactory receptor 52A5-like [Clupea harengus]
MENYSINSDILEIQGLDIPESSIYPVFFAVLFFYITLLISNFGVLILIITEKSLHQPMYLLFCNLSVNDLFGNTVLLPRLLSDMFASKKLTTYAQCATQAFCSHIFGSASHMILMLGLTIRLSRCRYIILNAYCDNASLFKLSCEDVYINNLYGLVFTAVLFGSSIGCIVVTYLRIAMIFWTKKSKVLNNRALQTCGSHLLVFMIMIMTGFLTIILHRFPDYPYLRKLAYIFFHVVPANLNPIIYGMQTKSLRQKIWQILFRKVSSSAPQR